MIASLVILPTTVILSGLMIRSVVMKIATTVGDAPSIATY